MIAMSLIHLAIWTQFAVFHAASMNLDLHAAKPAAAQAVEKVVLRENSLGEQLGLETATVVEPDKEMAALQADASGFTSSVHVPANAKRPRSEFPVVNESMDWKKRFDFSWDDDGAFWLGGKYCPVAPDPPRFGGW
jgi:hypothetical protein